ncbi:acetylglutamate kinase [Sphingomicrobium sediminis]|uniref:Acetylglutamate kinase n=1 Tax=Sphingomicrobium sediminis TaxID=2950949 RepID=A0A9X2EJZ9_9SPHN|nr:acetylglutamate kinase [Sphingomicrobium sediminis]MCM8558226.1 acetylglutamate kinase [Sphingomicrobium sediminis]
MTAQNRIRGLAADETARVLVEALPYVKRFDGKTIVVKLGGNAIDAEVDKALAQDVLLLRQVGVRCIVVHGGGPQIDETLTAFGIERQFKDGLRVTDAATLEAVRMTLVGKVNRDLVAKFNVEAPEDPVAVGVSGEDGGLLLARQLKPELGFVGEVEKVRASVLTRLLDEGLVPIVSTVGADAKGQPYNINADAAACAIASEVGAEKIVYLTAAPGLLADPGDQGSLISRITAAEAEALIASGAVGDGMIPKLTACIRAVIEGVPRAHILDGRIAHSLLIEVLTESGIGTMITPRKVK